MRMHVAMPYSFCQQLPLERPWGLLATGKGRCQLQVPNL